MALVSDIHSAQHKANEYDVKSFEDVSNSYRQFLLSIGVVNFRHINNLELKFDHPVTVISGTNKVGKTSILLLIACSHVNFLRIDSTSPSSEERRHTWRDVLSFTHYENTTKDYKYELKWRVGEKVNNGTAKRLATSRAWSGLGKYSSDKDRLNAQIRNKEVRLIDLERILPARSFSNSLYRKVSETEKLRVNSDIEEAFSYIFDISEPLEIHKIGSHINKTAFLIKYTHEPYSSYNAASGEEATIAILKELIDSPDESLILIDEVEAGFHPYVQRKLAEIIQYYSWKDKKQVIITSHSPTLISAFPQKSRKFIEYDDEFKVISNISKQAAFSKMDSVSYPLIRLYCEDDIAEYLIRKVIVEISDTSKYFHKLINIIRSGAANEVINDYERHKRNFNQYRQKIGFAAVVDGDKVADSKFSKFLENPEEKVHFIYPYESPEKFLVELYLKEKPNDDLKSALKFSDHHILFHKMVELGLATDRKDAINECYSSFKNSDEYTKFFNDLKDFLLSSVKYFSENSS